MPSSKNPLTFFATGFRTLFPSCREATRLQSDLLERELNCRQRFGLRLHLLLCSWCRRYGKQVRFLRHALDEHPEHLVDASPQCLSPEARERIKRAIREQA